MGLDYESLCTTKPDIILARISTFGPDGPYAQRLGFDSIAQAMSGAMSLTGFPGIPTRALVPFEDYTTALHTAFGVMVALFHRATTGQGQIVDGSLLASGVTLMQPMLAECSVLGVEREQRGNAGFDTAPADTFKTRDGWIIVQVVGSDMFALWASLMDRADLIDNLAWAGDLLRADNYLTIAEIMNAWLKDRTTEKALTELEAARVSAGPVYSLQQVLEDPQVNERQLLRYMDYPGAPAPVPIAETAVRLSQTPATIRHRAPTLGEHTDQILKEIGYTDPEIAKLREAEAV